jgi:hypothetical protein
LESLLKNLESKVENKPGLCTLERWLNDSVRGSVKAVIFEIYTRLVRLHIARGSGA